MAEAWFVGVDIGGTFTDVVAIRESDGRIENLKVPSSRQEPGAAVMAAIRTLESGTTAGPRVRLLLHGTTLVTNAIIERRLARTAVVSTEGFRDVLEIGRHWRRELYDPFHVPPPPLVPRHLRFEVRERMDASGTEVDPLDTVQAKQLADEFRRTGIEAVAIAFLHSYRNPAHEEEMVAILRDAWGGVVCSSSELSREIREYERTSTTALNAALIPLTDRYISRLESDVSAGSAGTKLLITQSNGGALTPAAARRRPVTLAMSGPVAGVVACSELARSLGIRELVGLDMGGTSTDISVIVDGLPRFTNELSIGDMVVRLRSIEINSIGAGGGSIAAVDAGRALRVGPQSAGAEPGPACYDRGGTQPTVTDCQLVLGRLAEDAPLAGQLRLSANLARLAIEENVAAPIDINIFDAAAGVIDVTNAAMEAAIRVALRRHGDDPREFALVAFGGAGPMHAGELARKLGMKRVIVPPHPGTFSALGVLASDVRLDFARSEVHVADESDVVATIQRIYAELERQAQSEVDADVSIKGATVHIARSCDMRYRGQAYELTIPVVSDSRSDDVVPQLVARFHQVHKRTFGFATPGDPCELVTFRVAASIRLDRPAAAQIEGGSQLVRRARNVYVGPEGFQSVQVMDRESLSVGSHINGPAVIHQADATTYVPPFASARVDPYLNLIMTVAAEA